MSMYVTGHVSNREPFMVNWRIGTSIGLILLELFRRATRCLLRSQRFALAIPTLACLLVGAVLVPPRSADARVTQRKLSHQLSPGQDELRSYRISPDGRWIVYYTLYPSAAPADGGARGQLYSVPAAGGSAVQLNGPLPDDRFIYSSYAISPDSQFVIYMTYVRSGSSIWHRELVSVPIAGGEPIILATSEGQGLRDFYLGESGSRLVFQTFRALYSIPIAGGAPSQLSPQMVTGGYVRAAKISPNGEHVVYVATQERYGKGELYSVPITGGSVTKLNPPIGDDDDVGNYFLISPDSRFVVYVTDYALSRPINERNELLRSVPIGGGESVELSAAPPLDRDMRIDDFAISGDSRHVVYTSDQDIHNQFELYTAQLSAGNTARKLNPPIPESEDITYFRLSPDSNYAVYRKREEESSQGWALFSVSLDTGAVHDLSKLGTSDRNARWYAISPDSSFVVYRADHEVDDQYELYAVSIDGTGDRRKLSGDLTPLSDVVADFRISADNRYVIYVVNSKNSGGSQLFAVPSAGGTPLALRQSVHESSRVYWASFGLGQRHFSVVYFSDSEFPGRSELYQSTVAECAGPADCAGGTYCVDGVCCSEPCGGGVGNDCQACSLLAGAQQDGQCEPVRKGQRCGTKDPNLLCDADDVCDGESPQCPDLVADEMVCRPSANPCDRPEHCDGLRKHCPTQDLFFDDGTFCPGGQCYSGRCELDDTDGGTSLSTTDGGMDAGPVDDAAASGADTNGRDAGPAQDDASQLDALETVKRGGCACRATDTPDGWSALWWISALIVLRRRRIFGIRIV